MLLVFRKIAFIENITCLINNSRNVFHCGSFYFNWNSIETVKHSIQ